MASTLTRRRGTPNRATRAVKESLAEILERADVQEAVRRRILKGDTVTQVSAGGYHTCGLKGDGTVASRGQNGFGQSTPPLP